MNAHMGNQVKLSFVQSFHLLTTRISVVVGYVINAPCWTGFPALQSIVVRP